MNLIVTSCGNGTQGRLAAGRMSFPCALGKNGVTADKTEGDGASPAGTFALGQIFYRPDRLKTPPLTGLPVRALTPDDGWCDDPAHTDYNTLVFLPHPARCERLWRDDGAYDIVAVLGYNDRPVVTGRGSAIFLHVALPASDGGEGYKPTEGCVALSLPDLLAVLAVCDSSTRLTIEG